MHTSFFCFLLMLFWFCRQTLLVLSSSCLRSTLPYVVFLGSSLFLRRFFRRTCPGLQPLLSFTPSLPSSLWFSSLSPLFSLIFRTKAVLLECSNQHPPFGQHPCGCLYPPILLCIATSMFATTLSSYETSTSGLWREFPFVILWH